MTKKSDTDRAVIPLRVPIDVKAWLEKQATFNCSSQNAVVVRALRAGIDRGLAERHALRQCDARLGLLDGEGPAGTGGVPVELVIVREKPDLPRGAIANDISVLAGREHPFGAADA